MYQVLILAYPNFEHDIILDTDASNCGVGSVLSHNIERTRTCDYNPKCDDQIKCLMPLMNACLACAIYQD